MMFNKKLTENEENILTNKKKRKAKFYENTA